MTRIEKLNKELGNVFGKRPNGDSIIKWALLRDEGYLYETEKYQEQVLPSGIIAMISVWEKHDYSEVYGDGWAQFMWKSPRDILEEALQRKVLDPENEWTRVVNGAFPYPNNGQYAPIENTILPPGEMPTERLNTYAIHAACEHFGMKIPDHIRAAKATLDEEQKQDSNTWKDAVDQELMTKFDSYSVKTFQTGQGDSPIMRRGAV